MADEVFTTWRITVDLHTDVLEADAQRVLDAIKRMDEIAGADLEDFDG